MPEVAAVQGDITRLNVDAIVNAADNAMRGGGGVDGAIHRAGGFEVLQDCIRRFPDGLATGDAGWTIAGNLPTRWVIHTVGPNHARGQRDRSLLESCYRRSLEVADEIGARTVAFPLISAGVFGWPRQDAIRAALETLTTTDTRVEKVQLVAFDGKAFEEVDGQLTAWTPIRILQGVGALHRRGYQRVRVLAGMAPSGMYWRIRIAAAEDLQRDVGDPLSANSIGYSTGSGTRFAGAEVSINTSPEDVADIMLHAVPALAQTSDDPEYVDWYSGLLSHIKNPGLLPVAYADHYSGAGWQVGWGSTVRYPEPPQP